MHSTEGGGWVLQAWTTHVDAHLPHKLLTMRASPAVHNGFLKSWRANGLHLQVLEMVRGIVQSLEVPGQHVKVYVTGDPRPSASHMQSYMKSVIACSPWLDACSGACLFAGTILGCA